MKRPELSLELHIAGRKMNLAYYESLVKLAAEEGVTERVVFHDFVHDMNSLLEETDILLVCSRSESFGRACVEGMLKGCVVIGANNTGTSEILQQNKYGYLYTTGDAEDLANRIIQITDKPDSHVALTKVA